MRPPRFKCCVLSNHRKSVAIWERELSFSTSREDNDSQTINFYDSFSGNYFPESFDEADTLCNDNYAGGLLASIHSEEVPFRTILSRYEGKRALSRLLVIRN